MIVICEECGKKYRIDPSKIRGAAARFKCRVCTHMIMVSKPSTTATTVPPTGLPDTNGAAKPAEEAAPPAEPEIKLDRSGGPPVQAKEDFMNDMGFKTLAVQKVGLTGYTALYEMPDSDGIWRTWAHVNPKIVGIDMASLKKPMGRNFPGFWKIFSGVKGRKRAQGYYTWQDKDGKFREKFMVCTPVAGTPYVVAATTYVDEFHGPVNLMQTRAAELTQKTRWIIWAILGGTLLLIGLIVAIYSHRLTAKIKSLTDVAERISIGDLGIEIKTTAKDEIGELAEAISRMQESIRMSIERLRRRR